MQGIKRWGGLKFQVTSWGDYIWRGRRGVWRIRGPILGQPMYWVYLNRSRYTPTGRVEDVVSFSIAQAAASYIAAHDFHANAQED